MVPKEAETIALIEEIEKEANVVKNFSEGSQNMI